MEPESKMMGWWRAKYKAGGFGSQLCAAQAAWDAAWEQSFLEGLGTAGQHCLWNWACSCGAKLGPNVVVEWREHILSLAQKPKPRYSVAPHSFLPSTWIVTDVTTAGTLAAFYTPEHAQAFVGLLNSKEWPAKEWGSFIRAATGAK